MMVFVVADHSGVGWLTVGASRIVRLEEKACSGQCPLCSVAFPYSKGSRVLVIYSWAQSRLPEFGKAICRGLL